MRLRFAAAILSVALSLVILSCRHAARSMDAKFSADEAHESFQAATMSGDAALIREVSKRLCVSIPDGASQPDVEKFVEEHKAWAFRNALFIARLRSPEDAKTFVAQHMPPPKSDCPRPSSAAHDACALASWPEVTEATGMPVGYTSSVKDASDESECAYHPTRGSLRGVMILVKWTDGSAQMRKTVEELQAEDSEGKSMKQIAGVGEEAYAAGDDFYVRRNDVFVTIRLAGLAGSASEKAKNLARRIVGRL
jgi:hypothetical protein